MEESLKRVHQISAIDCFVHYEKATGAEEFDPKYLRMRAKHNRSIERQAHGLGPLGVYRERDQSGYLELSAGFFLNKEQ